MVKGELIPLDVKKILGKDYKKIMGHSVPKPTIIRLDKKILVELDKEELMKMCEACITKCKKTDKELVGCNLIFARKFKVVKKWKK